MGLPIITTRRGGIPEEVTEDGAILLATNDKFVESLTNAILSLYEHPQKRQQMSQALLAHAGYYNKQRYAEDFYKAIDSFIE